MFPIVQKVARRVNAKLPPRFRRQVATELTYGEAYFEEAYGYLTPEQVESYAAAVIRALRPRSAIDLGCGPGLLVAALARQGVPAVGFDASAYAVEKAHPAAQVFVADLTKPFRANRRYDVAICTEVAEHLPPRVGPTLVASLASVADHVVFTAAQPGQEGIDHINLRPKSYWIERFAEHGFRPDEGATRMLLRDLEAASVPDWFRGNLIVLRRQPRGTAP
jgi:SAM-dependent methyltransferase